MGASASTHPADSLSQGASTPAAAGTSRKRPPRSAALEELGRLRAERAREGKGHDTPKEKSRKKKSKDPPSSSDKDKIARRNSRTSNRRSKREDPYASIEKKLIPPSSSRPSNVASNMSRKASNPNINLRPDLSPDSSDSEKSPGNWNSYLDKLEQNQYGTALTSPSKKYAVMNSPNPSMLLSPDSGSDDDSLSNDESGNKSRSYKTPEERSHHIMMKEKIRASIKEKKLKAEIKRREILEKERKEKEEQKSKAERLERELEELKKEVKEMKHGAAKAPKGKGRRGRAEVSDDENDEGEDEEGTFSKPLTIEERKRSFSVREENARQLASHLVISSSDESDTNINSIGRKKGSFVKPPTPKQANGGRGKPPPPKIKEEKTDEMSNFLDDSDESDYDEDEEEVVGEDDEEVYDWFAFDTKQGIESLTPKNETGSDPTATTDPNPSKTDMEKFMESSSDEDEDEDDVEVVGEDDEEVYDWMAMNTEAGMQEITDLKDKKEKKKEDFMNKRPNLSVQTAPSMPKPQHSSTPTAPSAPAPDHAVLRTPKIMKATHQENTPNSQQLPPTNSAPKASTPKIVPKKHSNPQPPSMPRIPQSPATPMTPKAPSQVSRSESMSSAGMSSPDVSSVKDTNKVKRKKASLPTNTPTGANNMHGSWLTNRYIVNNYIILNPLGQGSYAEVRLCKEKTRDELYAIKIMNKDLLMKKSVGMSSTFMDDVKREIAIMKKLRHDHVLQLYEVLDDPKVNKLYLVLQYCKNGDLMQMTKGNARTNSCNPLTDLQVWDVTRQIMKGLKYLHDNDIVHGDIKPQNLLVDKDFVIKIADFGISKMIESSDGEKEKLLETAGTPAFMSPELCAGLAYDGYLADVYAVGATMFMLRCGHPPFVANKLIALYNKIQEDPVVFTVDDVGEGLRSLICGMMEKDPQQRYTLVDCIKDPWLQVKPGEDEKKAAPSPNIEEKTKRVEVSNDDIFMSVHQATISHEERKQTEQAEMSIEETERRKNAFKKKASIRQRSFEKLDHLTLKEQESSSDESDDDGNVAVSKLDSQEFNVVMDTLSHQTPCGGKKKQAPLPHIVVGRVLDGLPNQSLRIRAAYHSEQGKRPNQEDTVTVIMDLSELGEVLGDRSYLYRSFAFFGIYDGHSGGATSRMLQHALHLKLARNEKFFEDQHFAAVKSCEEVDRELCSELGEKDDESGSTGLFAVIDGRSKRFTVGNVGDSRAVLSRGGTAIPLTRDHRLSRADERARVEKAGGKVKSNRVNGVLAVTRSFGDVAHKGAIDAVPEVKTEIITDRDEFLLMATDGLWDVMESQQAVNFVRTCLNRHHKVKLAVKEIVREALKMGSIDNVSAVIVMFNQSDGKGGPPPPSNPKGLR
ncbi:hypothetical protein TrVE_jg6117 [Triparma verrucosa]|uniref:Uncharacterized protein n=1 Tax=Triparma verrucosa TaxID=1606542 RepID=A0A9W7BHP6_9STRA|nr:hypothetical protein TrVE_jg6117 [Triparma verrucosa]